MPRVPPSQLYSGYRVSFAGKKRPGRGLDHSLFVPPRVIIVSTVVCCYAIYVKYNLITIKFKSFGT